MIVNGKEAKSLMLHCPLACGGYIENEILMYLLEGDDLYIYGKCGECGQGGHLAVSLLDLMAQSPRLTVM
jgi:hypothetical protein